MIRGDCYLIQKNDWLNSLLSLSLACEPARTVGTESSFLHISFLFPKGGEKRNLNRDTPESGLWVWAPLRGRGWVWGLCWFSTSNWGLWEIFDIFLETRIDFSSIWLLRLTEDKSDVWGMRRNEIADLSMHCWLWASLVLAGRGRERLAGF